MEALKKGIIVMGTPEFAVASLNALVESGLDVRAVVTAPDRPAGRGRKLRQSAMADRADELGIPVLKPVKLKDPEFHVELGAYDAHLFVVVAFRMLPKVVWAMPELGTINLHGSILPNYRGAAPINRAIMNGETRTGATTFFIEETIDTGDVIDHIELAIGPNETAGELHDRMKEDGAQLLVRTVRSILDGTVGSTPQEAIEVEDLRDAPKIHRADRQIDWQQEAVQVHNQIRGLSPYPGAFTFLKLDGKQILFKILLSALVSDSGSGTAGELHVEDGRLFVRCGNGQVEVLRLQPEGKRAMDAGEYLRGSDLASGTCFGD